MSKELNIKIADCEKRYGACREIVTLLDIACNALKIARKRHKRANTDNEEEAKTERDLLIVIHDITSLRDEYADRVSDMADFISSNKKGEKKTCEE